MGERAGVARILVAVELLIQVSVMASPIDPIPYPLASEKREGLSRTCGVMGPGRLEGPIDKSLPKSCRIFYIQAATSPKDRIALGWERDFDPREELKTRSTAPTARWNEEEFQRRFQEQQKRKQQVLKAGQTAAVTFIEPTGTISTVFLPQVQAGNFFSPAIKALFWRNEQLYLVLDVFSGPLVVWIDGTSVKEVAKAPYRITQRGAPWIFDKGNRLDVFWGEYYYPPLALPDSGMENQRISYCTWDLRTWGPRQTVQDVSWMLRMHETGYDVLPSGPGKYDLLFEQNRLSGSLREEDFYENIYHKRDLLRNGKAVRIGRRAMNGTRAQVALADGKIIVLWLEEKPTRRLVATEFTPAERLFSHGEWSRPVILTDSGFASYESLAAAGTIRGWTVALWTGNGKNLTCMMRSPQGEWTRPFDTPLQIGDKNYLSEVGDDLILITQMKENIYWCRLKLSLPR